jgi:hypothetical protein
MTAAIVHELLRFIDTMSREPGLVTLEHRIGPPAPPQLLASKRGVVPDAVIELAAIANGVAFEWHRDGNLDDGGRISIPALSARSEPFESFARGQFLLIDDYGNGFGAYYFWPPGAALDAATIVFAEQRAEGLSHAPLARDLSDYLRAAMHHRFAYRWADDLSADGGWREP